MRLWQATVIATALVLACSGCRNRTQRTVNVVGSTSIQPFAEMLAQELHKKAPEVSIDVQGGGSTAGVQALANGIAEIGMCSRSLSAEEAASYKGIVIARDGLAVVVNPSNPLGGLTRRQIQDLFSGRIANWKDLGGSDLPVRPITREEGSGTREAFTKLVMGKVRVTRSALVQESNGAVRELVRNDPGAVGYMSLGLVGDLKCLSIDGVAPSAETVASGQYPLVRPFLFLVKGACRPEAQRFIDFVLSPQGQRLLESEGLVKAQ
jgi:phosphate transport system substrate-binding protein